MSYIVTYRLAFRVSAIFKHGAACQKTYKHTIIIIENKNMIPMHIFLDYPVFKL